jgi:hypothetical protein
MEQKKYKQIKTIALGLDVRTDRAAEKDCADFDKQVNEALADGWYLDRRYSLPARTDGQYTVLVAELQRFDNA